MQSLTSVTIVLSKWAGFDGTVLKKRIPRTKGVSTNGVRATVIHILSYEQHKRSLIHSRVQV